MKLSSLYNSWFTTAGLTVSMMAVVEKLDFVIASTSAMFF